MEMATADLPTLPDVFSFCLENHKFRERWQDIYKLADEHIRETRLYCKDLFDSENWKVESSLSLSMMRWTQRVMLPTN